MSRTRSLPISCCVGLLGVALALGGSAGAVGADEPTPTVPSISFPLTTVVRGEPGTIHEITSSDVPADLVGKECSVTATAENNGSVHPQNDLIVASGSDQVIVLDVESAPGARTTAEGVLTLGATITVSVRLGPDGVFSGGGSVDLVCVEAATTTTTATATTTTSTTATPAVAPATVAPAAVAAATVAAPRFTG